MTITTKVDPVARTNQVLVDETLGPEARASALADFAEEEFARADAENRQSTGRTVPHRTFVDGVEGRAVASVSADGTIVYAWQLVDDLLAWIAEELERSSPKKSGLYAASHILFADGIEVPAGGQIPDAAEYSFVNAQPYARKIERGLSPSAPDGVYEAVAVLARRRFGNVASVKFSFRSLPSGGIGAWAARTSMKARRAKLNVAGIARQDWLTRQPAIIVTTGGR